jgi:hypothetical protein
MFSFTGGVNGIDYTTLLASVEISESQWFNGVFSVHPSVSDLDQIAYPGGAGERWCENHFFRLPF